MMVSSHIRRRRPSALRWIANAAGLTSKFHGVPACRWRQVSLAVLGLLVGLVACGGPGCRVGWAGSGVLGL
jgi:hypothetical protein